MIWTEEMKQTLRKFTGYKNYTYQEIAKIMTAEYGTEFTKNSVIGMAKRIGVPDRPPVIAKPKDAPVTIYELGWGMCKWPLGELSDTPPFMYCGKITGNGSWCPIHRKKALTSRFST